MKKGNGGSLKIIIPAVLVFALLAWFVTAAVSSHVGIKVITPPAGTNWSGNVNGVVANSTQVSFNVSFLNATDIWDPVNATFWINFTSGFAILGNSSRCTNVSVAALGGSCQGNINISVLANGSKVPDGIYTVNATLSNHTGNSGAYPSSNRSNMTTIIIDSTAPNQSIFQVLTSGNNHSTKVLGGNLTVNISVYDITSGVGNVIFFLVNESGSLAGNATLRAVREGSSTYWSASVNTSHTLDGTYNITALVNDTAGNFNNTINGSAGTGVVTILRKVIIDNTKPSAAAACSPTTVDVDDAFPCTCSASDVLAGVNVTSATSTSPQGTGIPTSSGTFTYTCSATDRAGNTGTSTATYTVQEAGSNLGSGSSGSGGSSGSSGSTGSGSTGSGSTGSGSNASTGNQGAGAGSGSSGQGQGSQPGSPSSSSSGMGWIIAIIVAVIIVVVIVVMLKKKK